MQRNRTDEKNRKNFFRLKFSFADFRFREKFVWRKLPLQVVSSWNIERRKTCFTSGTPAWLSSGCWIDKVNTPCRISNKQRQNKRYQPDCSSRFVAKLSRTKVSTRSREILSGFRVVRLDCRTTVGSEDCMSIATVLRHPWNEQHECHYEIYERHWFYLTIRRTRTVSLLCHSWNIRVECIRCDIISKGQMARDIRWTPVWKVSIEQSLITT